MIGTIHGKIASIKNSIQNIIRKFALAMLFKYKYVIMKIHADVKSNERIYFFNLC